MIYLILRNNICTKEYPDGLFHAHPEFHHIKKEGIGLIEAAGLFILPARIKTEMSEVEDAVKKEFREQDYLALYPDLTIFGHDRRDERNERIRRDYINQRLPRNLEECRGLQRRRKRPKRLASILKGGLKMTVKEGLKKAAELFVKTYHEKAGAPFVSYGRLEIMGNHTDHQHGHCIVAGCSLGIKGAVSRAEDGLISIASEGYGRFAFPYNDLA
jgi:hypothetical protein